MLSDSGTVQEEGCILGVPTVTLRDVTERPETLECGSNILTGCLPGDILRCLDLVLGAGGAGPRRPSIWSPRCPRPWAIYYWAPEINPSAFNCWKPRA